MLANKPGNYHHHQIFPPPAPMKTPIFALLCLLFLVATSVVISIRENGNTFSKAIHVEVDSTVTQPVTLSPLDSLLNQADLLLKAAKFDSAQATAKSAGDLAETISNQRGIVRSACLLGEALRKKGAFSEATTILNQCLEKSLDWFGEDDLTYAEANNVIGVVLHEQGQYEEALQYYQKALDIRRRSSEDVQLEIALVLNQIGVNYYHRGLTHKALTFLEESLRIRKDVLGIQHRDVAQSYNGIANAFFDLGDFPKAIDYHREALHIRRVSMGEKHLETAFSLHNLANAFGKLNEHEIALRLHQKSLEIFEAILGEQHYYVHLNIGSISVDYKALGEVDSALVYLKRSIELQNKYLDLNSIYIEPTLHNLGSHFFTRNDMDQAVRYYQAALTNSRLNLGEKHPKVADNLNALAQVAKKEKNYQEAIKLATSALKANQYDDANEIANLHLENFISIPEAIRSLSNLAIAMSDAGNAIEGPAKLARLQEAEAYFQALTNLLEDYRYLFTNEDSKILALKEYDYVFEAYVALMKTLHEMTHDDAYLAKAFEVIEQNKMASLRDALYESDARSFASISDSLLTLEKELRANMAFYDRQLKHELTLGEAADSATVSSFQNKVFTYTRKHEALLELFEKQYPQYYDLKYRRYRASLADIRTDLIDKDDALIEYFTGVDQLYALAITDETIALRSIHYGDSLANQIDELRSAIIYKDMARFKKVGITLYDELIKPIEHVVQSKRNWIISPHGKLNYIPFEVLPTYNWPDTTFIGRIPYTLQNHTVRYIYSSTIEVQDQNRGSGSWEKDFLAFAPVFENGLPIESAGLQVMYGQRGAKEPIELEIGDEIIQWPRTDSSLATRPDDWWHLPFTREEVKGIKKLFRSRYNLTDWLFGDKASIVLEEDATEAVLKNTDLTQHRYLHFATHGAINPSVPELSGILMAPDTTNGEDGVLHLGEIYNLNLNAELVVLSACETGLGKLAGGEGMIGLARGFKYAGANSLLVSLWPVDDISTKLLMTAFYDYLLQGKSKAEAIRLAKIDLIQMSYRFTKPFSWAGFILIGE